MPQNREKISGYSDAGEKKSAGISKIKLIAINGIDGVTVCEDESGVERVLLKDSEDMAEIEVREESASYEERVTIKKGVRIVEHILKFVIEPLGERSAKLVGELERCRDGVVAEVEMLSGGRKLVGYSVKFGLGRALKLHSVDGSSGERSRDISGETIVLKSYDDQKALEIKPV